MASWQSRVIRVAIRLWLKRNLSGRPTAEIVRFARGRLGKPEWLRKLLPAVRDVRIRPVREGAVRGEWVERGAVERTSDDSSRTAGASHVILYLHGGGYVACSPRTHRPITTGLARRTGARVFALDYRLAPEHPFPNALDDSLAAYRWLLGQGIGARAIAFAGDSAGGGLALATMLALRDAGEALPVSAALFSPWTDLAGTGESLMTNNDSDDMFDARSVRDFTPAYISPERAKEPLVSPLYGDLTDFPPLLLHVGASEILLDDSTRLADNAMRAGVAVWLRVFDDVPHVWHIFDGVMPEASKCLDEAAEFLQLNWHGQTKVEHEVEPDASWQ